MQQMSIFAVLFWSSLISFIQVTLSFSPSRTTISIRHTCSSGPSCLYLQSESNTIGDDISKISKHIASCIVFAMVLTVYEGYDCSFLKPLPATIRNFPPSENTDTSLFSFDGNNEKLSILQLMHSSTRGMGRGAIDRADGWYQDTYMTSRDAIRQDIQVGRNLPSYNEIMLKHRTSRVPSWKQDIINEEDVIDAVECIVRALETINQLKADSAEYEWEQMLNTLQEPVLTTELQDSCSLLQRAKDFLSTEIRQEIGFDWGSCAWRHCGAQADAQESLAELYNSIGMFEPFECLFTLDIVERSLRDIMTIIPTEYKPDNKILTKRIGNYIPYESKNVGGDEDGDGMDSIDADYLEALATLKNSLSFDDGGE